MAMADSSARLCWACGGREERSTMNSSRIGVTSTVRYIGALSVAALCLLLPYPAAAQTTLQLPSGFHASVYASGLSSPTAIAIGPDGRLYVAQENGNVLAVGAKGTTVIASGFGTALGLAWHNRI